MAVGEDKPPIEVLFEGEKTTYYRLLELTFFSREKLVELTKNESEEYFLRRFARSLIEFRFPFPRSLCFSLAAAKGEERFRVLARFESHAGRTT